MPWDAGAKAIKLFSAEVVKILVKGAVIRRERAKPDYEAQKLSTDGCPIWAISIVIRVQLRHFNYIEVQKS